MNEVALSTDIRQIELEIDHHKRVAGQSIWEIGRRIVHVKEHDLTHGSFGQWLDKINISSGQARKYMTIASNLNRSTSNDLGVEALYLISTLPEEEKQQELQKANRGEQSTVRELRELKKQLKETQAENRALEQAVRDQPIPEPRVVEKTVEKVPADYEQVKRQNEAFHQQLKQAEGRTQRLNQELDQLKRKRDELDEKSRKYDELNQAIQKMQGQLDEGQQKIAAQKEVYELVKKAKDLIKEVSPLTYLVDAQSVVSNGYAKKPLIEIAGKLHDIADNIERQLDGTRIIE